MRENLASESIPFRKAHSRSRSVAYTGATAFPPPDQTYETLSNLPHDARSCTLEVVIGSRRGIHLTGSKVTNM
jgi:hypothetical protein